MTRGVPHPPELRAEAVAAVLAGAALTEVARRYGVSKGTLGNWLAEVDPLELERVGTTRAMERSPELLEAMIFDLVAEHITTLRAQLQAAASTAYVQGQTAGDLAALLGAERDTLIRLLSGFRPLEPDQPELAAPADAAPGPGDDDR